MLTCYDSGWFIEMVNAAGNLERRSGGTSRKLAVTLDGLHITVGNDLALLSNDELDVRRRGLVGVDTTVSTVSAAAHLGGLVDLDVRDNKLINVEGLSSSVGLNVLEEIEEELAALLGPATERLTVLLSLRSTTGTIAIAGEGNNILVSKDVLEVNLSLLEVHAGDSSSGLTGVLQG